MQVYCLNALRPQLRLSHTSKLSYYVIENTLHLHYKYQLLNALEKKNLFLYLT